MGMHSKQKGKSGEREVRNLFRAALKGHMDIDAIRRNHQQAEIGGHDLVGIPFYSVEVKRYAKTPGATMLKQWWKQACDQADSEGKEPLLVFRQDRGQWQVMLWAKLYRAKIDAESWCAVTIHWEAFKIHLVNRVMCKEEPY